MSRAKDVRRSLRSQQNEQSPCRRGKGFVAPQRARGAADRIELARVLAVLQLALEAARPWSGTHDLKADAARHPHLPPEVPAALEAGRPQLAAIEARITPTMAEISAALNPALRVKGRKRAKTA